MQVGFDGGKGMKAKEKSSHGHKYKYRICLLYWT